MPLVVTYYHPSDLEPVEGATLNTLINSTDPVFVFAFWLGVGVATLALLMLMLILVLRQSVLYRERVHARALALWQKVLLPNPDPEPAIPPLAARDLSGFLEAWNGVHESVPASTPFLQKVAEVVELERRLAPRVSHGSFHSRLMSIIASGHLRGAQVFDRMRPFIDDRNPTVSLCAARALMQIDSTRAVSQFVPRIVSRGDWSQGHIATILAESQPAQVSPELAGATLQASAEIAPRLIRFLAGVSPEAASPVIHKLLAEATDERLISACLQVMSNPKDVEAVRPLLSHQRWHVRMQAAVTLGRLGVAGDDARLTALLTDRQWWVRYRAAQALLKLSFVGAGGLRRIQGAQQDAYARDIIEHVLKEQEMGLTPQTA